MQNSRHVGGILDGLIKKWTEGLVKKGNATRKAFILAVDEETGKHAVPASFKNNELLIIVENSSWLYKLTLEKRKIIDKFNENYTGKQKLNSVRFRIGNIEN